MFLFDSFRNVEPITISNSTFKRIQIRSIEIAIFVAMMVHFIECALCS